MPCDADKLVAAIVNANADGGATLRLAPKCTYTLTKSLKQPDEYDGGIRDAREAADNAENGGNAQTPQPPTGRSSMTVTWSSKRALPLDGSTVTSNTTNGNGGGIFADRSNVLLRESEVSRNSAVGAASKGGGVFTAMGLSTVAGRVVAGMRW